MFDTARLSSRYAVRSMNDADADAILALCRGNPLFYRYTTARPTKEEILADLHLTPPGTDETQKYYVGFYKTDALVAVLDLIDGYPDAQTAFLGFFMVEKARQGRGVGSEIVAEICTFLKAAGKTAVRLAINKGNPQSTHFWKKNGFAVLREVEREDGTVLLAEKRL